MKIVKLKGGLGNQLFQYVFAKNLERVLNEEVSLDTTIYEKFKERKIEINQFNIKIKTVLSDEYKKNVKFGTLKYKVYIVYKILFDKNYLFEKKNKKLNYNKYKYFDGYWQDLSYFTEIEKEIREELTLKKTIPYKVEGESVAVGFRKGDYLKKKNLKKFGKCDIYYYKKAIEEIKRYVKNPKFYIFSDDIQMAQEDVLLIFSKEDKIIYVNDKKNYSPAEELVIMSKCKHAIIPNSTFSWWGAWLIKNPNKIVIVPKYWYKDGTKVNIIPNNWIKIKNKDEI